jgi:hypothetical protein
MAPLKPTPSSELKNFTGGLFTVQIDMTPDAGTPTWAELPGLTSYGPKYAQTTEDNTTLADGGWASKFPTGQAFTAAAKGFVVAQGAGDGTISPGLQFLLDTAKTFGNAGIVHLRHWRYDTLDYKADYRATCSVSLDEAKPPKLQEWSGTFEGMGKPNEDFEVPTEETSYGVGVGAASAGNFQLSYGGQSTANIVYNANAAAVKTALVALDDGFDASDWDVTGSAPNWVVSTPGGVLKAGTATLTGGALTVAPA